MNMKRYVPLSALALLPLAPLSAASAADAVLTQLAQAQTQTQPQPRQRPKAEPGAKEAEKPSARSPGKEERDRRQGSREDRRAGQDERHKAREERRDARGGDRKAAQEERKDAREDRRGARHDRKDAREDRANKRAEREKERDAKKSDAVSPKTSAGDDKTPKSGRNLPEKSARPDEKKPADVTDRNKRATDAAKTGGRNESQGKDVPKTDQPSDKAERGSWKERRDQRGDAGKPDRTRADRDDPRRNASDDRAKRLDDIRARRTRETENDGKRQVTREPGRRVIIRENNRVIIRHDETTRFGRFGRVDRGGERRDGRDVVIVRRPNGVEIVSIYDRHGNLIERRRRRNGREVLLIDNRRVFGPGARVSIGTGLIGLTVRLGEPRFRLPRRKYIVDYRDASDDDIYEALSAPPVEELRDRYTLAEIRYSHSLRERLRRVDLDSITFPSGSWEVSEADYRKLENLADVMLRLLKRNPDEMFLVEGHTDAVGSEEDNVTLSDRRAEAIAVILTEKFDVPPENIITQGYGEEFLKVATDKDEPANRRVSIRRVTPLLARNK